MLSNQALMKCRNSKTPKTYLQAAMIREVVKRCALVVALLLVAACERNDNSQESSRSPHPEAPSVNRQDLGIFDPRNRGWKPSRSLSTEDDSDFVVGESYVYLGNGVFRCQKVIDVNKSVE